MATQTHHGPYELAAFGAFVGSLPGAAASTAILIGIKATDSLSALGFVPFGMLAIVLLFTGGTIGCWRVLRNGRVAKAGVTAAVFSVIALALTVACVYLGVVSGQTIYSPITALEYMAVTGLSATSATWVVKSVAIR